MTDTAHPLPDALARQPALDLWITFNAGGSVTIRTGKVELGQGIHTAIAVIAAEELDLDLGRIHIARVDTQNSPNEMITAGSMSIEGSGAAVRTACAEARRQLLLRAAQLLQMPVNKLEVTDGSISIPGGNASTNYWELTESSPLSGDATGLATTKPWNNYTLIGKAITRLDLTAKVSGDAAFIQDYCPDRCCSRGPLLHARVVRPGRFHDQLIDYGKDDVLAMQGVQKIIEDGNFLAVLAETEFDAVCAQEKLAASASWRSASEQIPADIHQYLRENISTSLLLRDGTPVDEQIPPHLSVEGGIRISAGYTKPFHMHASMGPSAARAYMDHDGILFIVTHSQGPHLLPATIGQALAIDPDHIRVQHWENAGCYGHNGADDAAMDAALIASHSPGFEILLKWTRRDENKWEPYSPAMLMDLGADLVDGKIATWNADIISQTHGGRPMPFGSRSNLIAAWQKSRPLPRADARTGRAPHGGIHRNADPYYDIPARRITKNLVSSQVVRTSSTRGLGAFANVFAIESFMDELAHKTGTDPVTFRLRHLSDPRAKACIKLAWEKSISNEVMPPDGPCKTGRGLAFARYKNAKCYAAVVVQLAVNEETAGIQLLQADIAADAGQIIDPDGLANQLEGGFIQAASWTLKEQVQFDQNGTTSLDWESYPILRFSEIPEVFVHLIDHPELPGLGSGEATQGPASAAIANAIYDAVGLRLRDVPLTPERLRQAAMDS